MQDFLFDYKIPLALSRGANTHEEIKRLNKFWKEISSSP